MYVFVVAMRTGENFVSVTDTEHGASVQFYFGDGENSSIDQSVTIFFQTVRPYNPLLAAFSSSAVSNLSPPLFLFCNHTCVALHLNRILQRLIQGLETCHQASQFLLILCPVNTPR